MLHAPHPTGRFSTTLPRNDSPKLSSAGCRSKRRVWGSTNVVEGSKPAHTSAPHMAAPPSFLAPPILPPPFPSNSGHAPLYPCFQNQLFRMQHYMQAQTLGAATSLGRLLWTVAHEHATSKTSNALASKDAASRPVRATPPRQLSGTSTATTQCLPTSLVVASASAPTATAPLLPACHSGLQRNVRRLRHADQRRSLLEDAECLVAHRHNPRTLRRKMGRTLEASA
ncbi:uncharacterized protein LOC144164741 [Haemaphysalis longicornis]